MANTGASCMDMITRYNVAVAELSAALVMLSISKRTADVLFGEQADELERATVELELFEDWAMKGNTDAS